MRIFFMLLVTGVAAQRRVRALLQLLPLFVARRADSLGGCLRQQGNTPGEQAQT
jgi:hypothetical protein